MNTFESSLRHLVPAVLAGFVITAAAAPKTGPIEEGVYRAHIARLASDEFGGRKPGTESEKRTLDYLEARVSQVRPEAGQRRELPAGSSHGRNHGGPRCRAQFHHRWSRADLKFREDMVIWTKRVKPAESMEASPMVFVGHGVTAPEYGWDDYAGVDMRGKTAVILINDPGFATGDATLFRGRAMTYYGRWTYKFEEAARRGATGAIIVHQTEPAAYGWDTVVNSWSTPQLDHATADGNAGRVAIEGGSPNRWREKLFAANGTTLGGCGEARQHARISRRAAEEHGERVAAQRDPPHEFAQLRGRAPGSQAARRIPRLHGALGSSGKTARAAPATASSTARSTMPPAPRDC